MSGQAHLNRVDAVVGSSGSADEAVATFQPLKHDLVVYDNHRMRLMVHASDAQTVAVYRTAFSSLLFGGPEALDDDAMVTGAPLVERKEESLLRVPGMKDVRLVELVIEVHAIPPYKVHLSGKDVFAAISELSPDLLDRGVVRFAKFKAWYSSGGKGRVIELNPPTRVQFDPRRDAEVTRQFLDDNNFLAVPAKLRVPRTSGA